MSLISLHPASLSDIAVPSPALTAGLAQGFAGDEAGGHTAISEVLTVMSGDAGPDPFGVYWALRGHAYVGLCSFKRGLSPDGAVEIAYYTFPDVERQGVAGGMVEALILIAWQAHAVALTAHTLPEESASASVLRRAGFTWLGEVDDPEDGEVWAWERAI